MAENIVLKIDQILGILAEPRLYAMSRIQLFLSQCFLPGVFYDIGANDPFSVEGQQTIYKPLMPKTKFFLFEAMAKHEPALIRSGEPYAIAILDEQEGMTKTFYQSKAYPPGNGDSLYLERTVYYAPESLIATEAVTQRLDSLVEKRSWPLPDFMKLVSFGASNPAT